MLKLLRSGLPDVFWVEKELLPWLPSWFERLCLLNARRVIIDYDDATFHRYDKHSSAFVRRFLGRKTANLMKAADAIVAGNEYIARYAESVGARRVQINPTVVDLARYPLAPKHADKVFRIVWIGTPLTSPYLELLRVPLQQLLQERDLEILLIGAHPDTLHGLPVHRREWTEAGEVASISEGAVGIMPLPDRFWERGKCGYKLIQYMASGIPVVASPVGANCQIVVHGQNGLLAGNTDEWYNALVRLRDDPEYRDQLGAAGRKVVEENFTATNIVDRLRELFYELTSHRVNGHARPTTILGDGARQLSAMPLDR
jgi:glycosyltransferase involved in cell wall biosynthesis